MDKEGPYAYNPDTTIKGYEQHSFHPLRIESATEQLRQICYSGCHSILDIGIAGGFLRHCLKIYPQITYTSLDISEKLKPDYVGSVTDMPFSESQFDMVICGQVLEHLPFSQFPKALAEIRRVSRHKAIISLPDKRRHFGIALCLQRLGWLSFEWNPAALKNLLKPFKFDGQHYWEIGCKDTTFRVIVRAITKVGFRIEKQYRLSKHDWHCFFILNTCKVIS